MLMSVFDHGQKHSYCRGVADRTRYLAEQVTRDLRPPSPC